MVLPVSPPKKKAKKRKRSFEYHCFLSPNQCSLKVEQNITNKTYSKSTFSSLTMTTQVFPSAVHKKFNDECCFLKKFRGYRFLSFHLLLPMRYTRSPKCCTSRPAFSHPPKKSDWSLPILLRQLIRNTGDFAGTCVPDLFVMVILSAL